MTYKVWGKALSLTQKTQRFKQEWSSEVRAKNGVCDD
jgi:hypothetical protein